MNVVVPIIRQPRLTIGLVNNASGRALLPTERQFARLLRGAGVRLRLFSCPGIARDGPAHPDRIPYQRFDDLFASELDAVIVTGMEPRTSRLQDEPVWGSLVRIADWAMRQDVPVLWSCLAAHAAVLHLDGIERTRLARKLFGVFACEIAAPEHPLVRGLGSGWAHPHSRYHDVAETDLVARGYRVLSRSTCAGVDVFTGPGQFVFFQGHPEYEAETLLGQYRRDLRRALRGQGEDPTQAPCGIPSPPPWRPCAVRLFANWIDGFAPGACRNAALGFAAGVL